MEKEHIKSIRAESPVGRIFDLPEFLSPMLVKELRQGLRSIGFTGLFIGMQALLSITILMMLLAAGDSSPSALSSSIFSIYIITVCGIQPLRGLNAISAEVKEDTIDLVIITKLTSWKIVFGKWFSLVGQSLLFASSLLPYLILRYFMGDMLLFNELYLFGIVFVISCVSTAVSVGTSAVCNPLLRRLISGGIVGGILMLTFTTIGSAIAASSFIELFWGSSISMMIYVYVALTLLILGGYLSWLFLDFGASIIAPISENRATLRRLLYFFMLCIGIITSFLLSYYYNHNEELLVMVHIALVILFAPFFTTTFTEPAHLSPRIVIAMKKRAILSRFRFLLYPGWATGTAFSLLSIFILLTMPIIPLTVSNHMGPHFDIQDSQVLYCITTCILGSLLFPAAALSVFARNVNNRLAVYLITFIASMIITFIVSIMAVELNNDVTIFFTWLPSVNMFIFFDTNPLENLWVGVLNSALIAAYLIIILIRSIPVWKHIKKQEKLVEESIQKA